MSRRLHTIPPIPDFVGFSGGFGRTNFSRSPTSASALTLLFFIKTPSTLLKDTFLAYTGKEATPFTGFYVDGTGVLFARTNVPSNQYTNLGMSLAADSTYLLGTAINGTSARFAVDGIHKGTRAYGSNIIFSNADHGALSVHAYPNGSYVNTTLAGYCVGVDGVLTEAQQLEISSNHKKLRNYPLLYSAFGQDALMIGVQKFLKNRLVR